MYASPSSVILPRSRSPIYRFGQVGQNLSGFYSSIYVPFSTIASPNRGAETRPHERKYLVIPVHRTELARGRPRAG